MQKARHTASRCDASLTVTFRFGTVLCDDRYAYGLCRLFSLSVTYNASYCIILELLRHSLFIIFSISQR